MSMTIVTGASSGLGHSLAQRLAADGTPVALVARRKHLLEDLAHAIERAGGRALALPCDVCDVSAVAEAVLVAEAELGPTTCLVANAGGSEATHVAHFSAAHVERQLALNVVGAANWIEAVLPGMLARRDGHLVVTSSLAGYRGLPARAAYSASKAALTTLMEGLRVDLRGSGVDVTVLAPGFVRTKPDKQGKRRPFSMDVERATLRMHQAIRERRSHDAFPASLAALARFGWAIPAAMYDRLVGGPRPKPAV